MLERRFDAPAARVRGDPTHAFEAVMNLCTNALQSMPNGGVLAVAIERKHVAAARVLSHSEIAAGRYLALTVTDQVTGAVRTYVGGATNGTDLCGQADTTAFRNQ